MMNVITGRHRNWKRNSIAELDRLNNNNNNNDLKSLHEVHRMFSIPERASSTRRRDTKVNKYLYMLENIERTSSVTPDDIQAFRKDFISNLASCSNSSNKIVELNNIIQLINAIPLTSPDTQYLAQYQYIVNWYYCQLRFISDPVERRRLFKEAKEKYRKMFELIADLPDSEKLPSYLHWSQLCYEYAELVDEESLVWCKEAISNASSLLSASSSRGSTLSRGRDSISLSDSYSVYNTDRKTRFINETVEYIQENILKTENIRTYFGLGYSKEKYVM